jgi:hypothetical protein
MFSRFDADGNGDIDKNEFLAALQALSIPCTPAQMGVVWPLFCRHEHGKIGLGAWKAFLGGTQWSHELVQDSLSKQVSQDELDAAFNVAAGTHGEKKGAVGRAGNARARASVAKLPPMVHIDAVAVGPRRASVSSSPSGRSPLQASTAASAGSGAGGAAQGGPPSDRKAASASSVASSTSTARPEQRAPLTMAERAQRLAALGGKRGGSAAVRRMSSSNISTLSHIQAQADARTAQNSHHKNSSSPSPSARRSSIEAGRQAGRRLTATSMSGGVSCHVSPKNKSVRKMSVQLTAEIQSLREKHAAAQRNSDSEESRRVTAALRGKEEVGTRCCPTVLLRAVHCA